MHRTEVTQRRSSGLGGKRPRACARSLRPTLLVFLGVISTLVLVVKRTAILAMQALSPLTCLVSFCNSLCVGRQSGCLPLGLSTRLEKDGLSFRSGILPQPALTLLPFLRCGEMHGSGRGLNQVSTLGRHVWITSLRLSVFRLAFQEYEEVRPGAAVK